MSAPRPKHRQRRRTVILNFKAARALSRLGLDAFNRTVAALVGRHFSVNPVPVLSALELTPEQQRTFALAAAIVLLSVPPKTRARIALSVLGAFFISRVFFAAVLGWYARTASQPAPAAAAKPPSWRQRFIARIQSIWGKHGQAN
jgi:hypothetical protein